MSTKPKTEEPEWERRRIHFGLLLLFSFLLFTGAYVIDQTLRWTNHLAGFVNGAFHGFFMGCL